jgi:hypothetical protein
MRPKLIRLARKPCRTCFYVWTRNSVLQESSNHSLAYLGGGRFVLRGKPCRTELDLSVWSSVLSESSNHSRSYLGAGRFLPRDNSTSFQVIQARSSVGERFLDTEEAGSSILPVPTIFRH